MNKNILNKLGEVRLALNTLKEKQGFEDTVFKNLENKLIELENSEKNEGLSLVSLHEVIGDVNNIIQKNPEELSDESSFKEELKDIQESLNSIEQTSAERVKLFLESDPFDTKKINDVEIGIFKKTEFGFETKEERFKAIELQSELNRELGSDNANKTERIEKMFKFEGLNYKKGDDVESENKIVLWEQTQDKVEPVERGVERIEDDYFDSIE